MEGGPLDMFVRPASGDSIADAVFGDGRYCSAGRTRPAAEQIRPDEQSKGSNRQGLYRQSLFLAGLQKAGWPRKTGDGETRDKGDGGGGDSSPDVGKRMHTTGQTAQVADG